MNQQQEAIVEESPSYVVPKQEASGITHIRYYIFDHLGTVRIVTDGKGEVVSTHDYEPFGVEIPPFYDTATATDFQSANTHKFTGHERDQYTNYDYMHFRFYASSMGRFLKPDNIIPDLTNPQNWNAYTYVKGNPVNFNDPTGHSEIRDYSTAGTSESGIAKDNGEPPSLGGWDDNVGDTISNIKYRLMKAGFSKQAVDRAAKEGNLKPVIKSYVVHGGEKYGGHVAISATLGGESIWWSHGGGYALYGRKGLEEEQLFISYYQKNKEVKKIEVFTLNLSMDESIEVASEINRRVFYPKSGEPNADVRRYAYNQFTYNCIESVSDILFDAGVYVLLGKRQLMPMSIVSILFDMAAKEKEIFYPKK